MTCDLGRLLKNIEGRLKLAEDHFRFHSKKAVDHVEQADEAENRARRYIIAVDVIKEILESGELK